MSRCMTPSLDYNKNQEIFNLNNNNNNHSAYDRNCYERMIIGVVIAIYSIDVISIALLAIGLK
jgi:hypothetical protein